MYSIVTRFIGLAVHLVQRHLAHTVDGIVGIVGGLRHTVLSTLHHHTTAKDTTEVGTLDGVHDTTGIDGHHTILLPNDGVRHFLAIHRDDDIYFSNLNRSAVSLGKHCQQLVHRQVGTLGIFSSYNISTFLQAFIFQLIIGFFALWEFLICFVIQLFVYMIVIGTVVGDVQLTVAIDEGQVTIAIETAGMPRTNGDEVAVIGIVDRSCGVAIDCRSIGKQRGTTLNDVTTGKDGIVDDDTIRVKVVPVGGISFLVLQFVKG